MSRRKKARLDAMIDPVLKQAAMEVAEESGISLSCLVAQMLAKHPAVKAKNKEKEVTTVPGA